MCIRKRIYDMPVEERKYLCRQLMLTLISAPNVSKRHTKARYNLLRDLIDSITLHISYSERGDWQTLRCLVYNAESYNCPSMLNKDFPEGWKKMRALAPESPSGTYKRYLHKYVVTRYRTRYGDN